MRQWLHRVALSLLIVASLAGLALADTIVLKNGHRISATNVVEEGNKVSFETGAGRLSLPRSSVDHIDRGGAAGADAFGSAGSANGAISPSAPPAPLTSADADAISKAVLARGSIDRDYLARLEAEADRGAPGAGERAAIAHHFAAQFEADRGDLNSASTHYRRALIYAPDNPGILLNAAYLLLRQSAYGDALELLEHARRVDPQSADVAKFMGWAYAGQNKFDLAVAEWKRSLSLRADPEVERALAKAQRDQQEEAGYREGTSTHFQVRYSGAAAPQSLVRDVLRDLEADFSSIESVLNFTPPDPIGVVLYTDQAFTDITRAPSWAGALNDGRIRIPVQGLHEMDPELHRSLKHELTHSFITQKTRGHCPTWLQEGIAQWVEGASASDSAAAFVSAFDRNHQTLSLGFLEGTWINLPDNDARVAYAWSLAVVEFVVKQGGSEDLTRLLNQIADGADTQTAAKNVLHMDYPELEDETVKYLRATYVH